MNSTVDSFRCLIFRWLFTWIYKTFNTTLADARQLVYSNSKIISGLRQPAAAAATTTTTA